MAISFTLPPITGDQEREMSRHQRGLVDTCFEEGQYESGISVLEQLRSTQLRPSESHIRQLLYIALYPPSPPAGVNNKGKYKSKEAFDPSTPTKSTVTKAQKSPLVPSDQATVAALRLLVSFAITNSPGALIRSLPEYVSVSDWNAKLRQIDEEPEEDSYIAREAMCIREAKNAWAILKDGFIQRKTATPATPKVKGKKKKRDYEYTEQAPILYDADSTAPLAIVAEYAWPVLDWLLMLFEKDELFTQKRDLPRHSPLLLIQTPPPRSGTARWDADAALDIVLYCLHQTDPRRKSTGVRLMTLLINLTSTVHFDINLFVTSVYTRLASLSSATSTDSFSDLLSALTPSPTVARFKIFLCKKFLTSATMTNPADALQSSSRPKPQARAIRASRRSGDHNGTHSTTEEMAPIPKSIINKHPLPQASEIIQLVEQPIYEASATSQSLRMKFELLISYALIQTSGNGSTNQDSEWRDMIRVGTVKKAVSEAFNHGEAAFYKDSLDIAFGI